MSKNIFNLIPDYEKNIYLLYDKNNNIINIPESVAIILDGNGRYARQHNLNISLGHKKGCETLEIILEASVKIGIKFLTVYAFSTENWKRSKEEIDSLFNLFFIYINKIRKKAIENNVKVCFIGDILKFPKKLIDECNNITNETKNYNKTIFTIALNYGARDEIIRAIKKINKNNININSLTEDIFQKYLDTNNIKNPDLLIRTSGEYRLSNFLLWQLAYSEFYFTDILWPDFTENDLYTAIENFNNRKRRFGGR